MFDLKTLFVVGAGASAEAKLPTGRMLITAIQQMLNLPSSETQRHEFEVYQELRKHASRDKKADINALCRAALSISRAMPISSSIDNYLYAHNNDKDIELCGKLGIAKSIIDAEKASLIFTEELKGKSLDFVKLDATWYNRFFRMMVDGISKEDTERIPKMTSFIVFNYDRCIEMFLKHAFKGYYRLDDKDAEDLVKKITIFHPYGTVGRLPWMTESGQGVPFGGDEYGNDLLDISSQVKTFSERIEDDGFVSSIRKQVKSADVIVFLGFAFHRQNMELLRLAGEAASKKVFATTKGISDADCSVVEERICDVLQKKSQHVRIYRYPGICVEIFDEFWLSMTTA